MPLSCTQTRFFWIQIKLPPSPPQKGESFCLKFHQPHSSMKGDFHIFSCFPLNKNQPASWHFPVKQNVGDSVTTKEKNSKYFNENFSTALIKRAFPSTAILVLNEHTTNMVRIFTFDIVIICCTWGRSQYIPIQRTSLAISPKWVTVAKCWRCRLTSLKASR